MNLPTILNVAIGLVVLYFLLSTIASLILELITTWARYREEILFVTVNRLLAGQPDRPWDLKLLLWDRLGEQLSEIWGFKWLGQRMKKSYQVIGPGKATGDDRLDIVQRFWAHPKIRSLAAPGTVSPPAMEPATFAQTLIDVVVPRDAVGALPDNPLALDRALAVPQETCPEALRQTLRKLADAGDIPRTATGEALWKPFSTNVASWYEEAGKRSTEEYRDTMRTLLLIIGFILAFALNADSVRTIQLLSRDRSLQETTAAFAATVVAQREQAAAGDAPGVADTKVLRQKLSDDIDQLRQLEALGFPLGWRGPDLGFYQPDFMLEIPTTDSAKREALLFIGFLLLKLTGLVATALAVAQGAPFWYDLMQKLIGLKKVQAGTADEKEKKGNEQKTGNAPALPTAAGTAVRPLEIGNDLAAPSAGFDARKGYWLAQAAQAAYASEAEIRKLVIETWKFHDLRFFDAAGTQAFCACDEKVVLIAFRGTELKELDDILADTTIPPERFTAWADLTEKSVHKGFQAALAHVLVDLTKTVTAWLDAVPARRVLVTGHSLGGALATLYQAHLMNLLADGRTKAAAAMVAAKAAAEAAATGSPDDAARKKKEAKEAKERAEAWAATSALAYTFGCPKVGSETFAQMLDRKYPDRLFRLINETDAVPALPPLPSFHHAGHALYFEADGSLRREVSGLSRLLGFAAGAVQSIKAAGEKAVNDHGMHHYVARCEKLVKSG